MSNKGPTTNVILSVSSKNISSNCREVIHSLRKAGIAGDVTPNKTILSHNTDLLKTSRDNQENGCRIAFGIPSKKNTFHTIENVWKELTKSLDIQCSHLNVNLNWGGCIYDYLRPTNCPGNKKAME